MTQKVSNNKITATQVSLPKGGGAIQGIGETFQPDKFTGTAALSIPIPTSPCSGFEPQLSVYPSLPVASDRCLIEFER
jgi:hypothetical protein